MVRFQKWIASMLLTGLLLLTGISVQAQTTTSFAYNATGVVYGGNWNIYDGIFAHHGWVGNGSSTIDLVATGTQFVIKNYFASGSTDWTVVVRNLDGSGAVTTTPTLTTGAWGTNLTIFTGLSDAAHWVSITTASQPAIDRDSTNAFSVTGAAPAIGFPTNYSSPIYMNSAGVSPHILVTGMNATTVAGNPVYQAYTTTDQEVWFYANMSALTIRLVASGFHYRLMNVDTGASTTAVDDASGLFKWQTLFTGLDTSRHLWKLTLGAGGGQSQIIQMMCAGGSGMDLTATVPARPILAVFGDSITQATVGTGLFSWLGYGHLLSDYLNYILYNFGLNSTSVSVSGGSNAGETDARCDAVISSSAAYCVILFGTNDIHAGVSAATFQTAFQSMLTKLCSGTTANPTGLPNCQFSVLGILPSIYDHHTQTEIEVYNTSIQAAITATLAAHPSAHIRYLPTIGWNMAGMMYAAGGAYTTFDQTNFYQGDGGGLHPNATGYGVMLTNLLPYFSTSTVRKIYSSRGNRADGRHAGRN